MGEMAEYYAQHDYWLGAPDEAFPPALDTIPAPKGFWCDRVGDHHLIEEMTDSHIRNAILAVQRLGYNPTFPDADDKLAELRAEATARFLRSAR